MAFRRRRFRRRRRFSWSQSLLASRHSLRTTAGVTAWNALDGPAELAHIDADVVLSAMRGFVACRTSGTSIAVGLEICVGLIIMESNTPLANVLNPAVDVNADWWFRCCLVMLGDENKFIECKAGTKRRLQQPQRKAVFGAIGVAVLPASAAWAAGTVYTGFSGRIGYNT